MKPARSSCLFKQLRTLSPRLCFAGIVFLGTTLPGLHADPGAATGDEDLTDLSLEELHALSLSAASKRSEPLFETPAAVSVLLPIDLERAGSSSVAEALRLVPGLHVIERLPDQWNIGVRGGNGVQSTKLLVLVDGRSVYDPFYGGVEWPNAEVALDDLSRIEVVRGPGATLWGANAVNGVINVISKDSRDTQGGVVSVRTGTEEPTQAHLRYGGQLDNNTWFRVYAGGATTEGATGMESDNALTGYRESRAGFRSDTVLSSDALLTTQIDHLSSTRTVYNEPSTHEADSALTRLQLANVAGGELQLQVYFDYSHEGTGSSDLGGMHSLSFSVNEKNKDLDFDLTYHVHLGSRHDLIVGGGARLTENTVESSENLIVAHPTLDSWLVNFFVQDEIALSSKWKLTVGTKFEHRDTIGWEPLPNIRLAWLPNSKQTFWAAASRAVRAPSRGEREALLRLATLPATETSPPVRIEVSGDDKFDAEINNAYELGWRWRATRRFQTDVSAYYFDYSHVRSLDSTTIFDPGPPLNVVQLYTLNNVASADTRGLEASWSYRVSDRWELNGGVSRQGATTHHLSDNPLVASDYAIPNWLWHVGSWWQLPREWEFSTTLYGVGRNERADLPAYLRLDVQFVWRPRPDVEFTIGVQNATDPSHNEVITGNIFPNDEVQRDAYTRIQWRF